MITKVLIDGEISDGKIEVTDSSVLRGDACFEVIRSYRGQPFAVEAHLDRLAASASALRIELPERSRLVDWIEQTSRSLGDGAVRVVVTRGSTIPGLDDPSRVIVFGHTWDPDDSPARLMPVVAPWHAAGVAWELAGAKITSYGPNLAAGRKAQEKGFDDALLHTVDGTILEGPTFSVGWVVDGVVETPTLALGILDSITRRVVLEAAAELGIDVVEGRFTLSRLDDATEMSAWSTIREVQPVVQVGARSLAPGPITEHLGEALRQRVRDGWPR
jgi:branched-subunit amino acid aminotransferase/4-amino-4-deoxychorismate lyase